MGKMLAIPAPEAPTQELELPRSRRKKIKELDVMIAEVERETHDTVSIMLFTGNDRLEYEAGHFLTIDPHQFPALDRFIGFFEYLKGKREPPRAYSLASAPAERHLVITVKEEQYIRNVTKYPPLLSPLLVRQLVPGKKMVITGFTGPYTLPSDVANRTDHLVHLCAGSGIVPNFSILKHALANHPTIRHTVIFSNRSWDDVIYREKLRLLSEVHRGRLEVVHTLTRGDPPPGEKNVYKGRITPQLLRAPIGDPRACLVYACGPAISPWDRAKAKTSGIPPMPRFLESALSALAELGVPADRIEHESYG